MAVAVAGGNRNSCCRATLPGGVAPKYGSQNNHLLFAYVSTHVIAETFTLIMSQPTIFEDTLASVPHRRSRKNIVVLKFGGTTVGATKAQGRIRLARQTIADLVSQGKLVVPVFSAYRRGRSGSDDKFSVTDLLQNYRTYVAKGPTFSKAMAAYRAELLGAHLNLIHDLELSNNEALLAEIQSDVDSLANSVSMAWSAFEAIPSLDDVIVTGGERLAVKVMSAYLNDKHDKGEFPMRTAPVTAMELGLYTDDRFGSATIDWARAVDHSREVILGQYLGRDILPIVTGFDGIYDPDNEFREIMQTPQGQQQQLEERYARVYRTSLGRGGSDLTATFLGLALDAEYVGFCKETPGVLTADDMLVGKAAQTVKELDFELATEAGNIYARAVEPVRAGNIPVHIFDPAQPNVRTVVSDVNLPAGMYIIERPIKAVNIHAGTIPDEPGALISLLQIFAEQKVNVEEIRHQRSGTDFIVYGDEDRVQKVVAKFNEMGLRPQAHFTWYIRVIGNVTEDLASQFNQFMADCEPLTLATYQLDTRVLTATVVRNRAGGPLEENERIEAIVQRIHDQLVVPDCPVNA